MNVKIIMDKPLSLFKTVNKTSNPACRLGAAGGCIVFKNGIKNADFIVFNPLNIELKDEKPLLQAISLKTSEFWQRIKSVVWSSNCRFFFVVNERHIIIGNVHDNEAFLCSNLSIQVFEEFFKAFGDCS